MGYLCHTLLYHYKGPCYGRHSGIGVQGFLSTDEGVAHKCFADAADCFQKALKEVCVCCQMLNVDEQAVTADVSLLLQH